MDKIQTNKFVPLLVVLLIIAAFFLGSLYTKVNMLEKGKTANTNTGGQVAGDTNQAPQPSAPAGPITFDISNLPILGNKDAKAMILIFTDYQCPFCKRFFDDALVQIKKEYVDTGKIRLAVKNFPLTQIHPYAQKAAEAAECAGEQGKFFEYHDKLFSNQDKLTVDDLKQDAIDLGLNTANFNSCLDTGKMADKVKADQTLGANSGVQGTPSSFVGTVNGTTLTATEVSGAAPFASFKTVIDEALK